MAGYIIGLSGVGRLWLKTGDILSLPDGQAVRFVDKDSGFVLEPFGSRLINMGGLLVERIDISSVQCIQIDGGLFLKGE